MGVTKTLPLSSKAYWRVHSCVMLPSIGEMEWKRFMNVLLKAFSDQMNGLMYCTTLFQLLFFCTAMFKLWSDHTRCPSVHSITNQSSEGRQKITVHREKNSCMLPKWKVEGFWGSLPAPCKHLPRARTAGNMADPGCFFSVLREAANVAGF